MANANVLKAIADMEANLAHLDASLEPVMVRAIYRDASICNDLMNYSHSVAGADTEDWKRLDRLVGEVMNKASKLGGERVANQVRKFNSNRGWYGFDLDGTTAVYEGWKGPAHIGAPIKPICDIIKQLLAQGERVKIFTARVTIREDDEHETARKAIEAWTYDQFGVVLEVTNVKDYGLIKLYDDRAVGVEENTGRIILNH